MNPEELEKLHRHHLSALLEADRLCRKYGLAYYMLAGTLLGAVRHKGAIPWDDDLDIGLLRPDYERFLRVAAQELDGRFFLQTNETDPEYFLNYAKIRINGTRFLEASHARCDIHHGVFIDIFPLDNAPDARPLRRLHAFAIKTLSTAAKARSKMVIDPAKKRSAVVYNTLRLLAAPFRLRTLIRLLDRLLAACGNDRSECIINGNSAYSYQKECMPRACFAHAVELEFEGHKIFAPEGWHRYLTQLYGDYMTPPPEDKRYNRHDMLEYEL